MPPKYAKSEDAHIVSKRHQALRFIRLAAKR